MNAANPVYFRYTGIFSAPTLTKASAHVIVIVSDKTDIKGKGARMIYSITAQCLTPIGDISMLNATCGIFQMLIRAESERSAIDKACAKIASDHMERPDETPVINRDAKTVTILDGNAHIVNYYWGFKGHEV